MLYRNIEAEYNRHLYRLQGRVFDEFTGRTEREIARLSDTGVLPRKMEDPVNRAGVFFDLIEAQYNTKLRECIEYIKALFARHDIAFRLTDINECMHGYHRMTMAWATLDRKEYIFDFIFDSSQDNPFDSFYRLGEFDGCGTITNGDILDQESMRLFEEEADLPAWFVNGLQRNS